MVIYYVSDTAGPKLGVGWRAEGEQNKTRAWEELNELGNTLSDNYLSAISRLELRNLTKVSDTTSHNNPREVTLINEMCDILLDLPDVFFDKCAEIAEAAFKKQQEAKGYEIPF